jgi:hypothetical protein
MSAQDKKVVAQARATCQIKHETSEWLALINHLHKCDHSISRRNSLVVKQQAVLAIGRDGHRYTKKNAKMDFSW